VVKGYVEISQAEYGEFSLQWIREAERVLRPGGSVYIVSGYTNLYHILHALRVTTLSEVNHLIWKYPFGVFTRCKYISSHYHILLYQKPGGKRTFNLECRYGLEEKSPEERSLNNADREDVWSINREYKPCRVKNKNELPVQLLMKMIQYSSKEGDLVCDFFLGGFSTAKAAIGLNRRVTGFEISAAMFDAKVHEIGMLRPGFLLSSVREPSGTGPGNSGKPWTEHDIRHLSQHYHRLMAQGVKKNQIIDTLGKDLGRGRWAIEKALKKAGLSTGRKSASCESSQ
jgi:site-specific DNA-methyltransferase (adenine-specific)